MNTIQISITIFKVYNLVVFIVCIFRKILCIYISELQLINLSRKTLILPIHMAYWVGLSKSKLRIIKGEGAVVAEALLALEGAVMLQTQGQNGCQQSY